MDKLRLRLINWGIWLNYEADLGPKSTCCKSLESRHLADTGDVWAEDDPSPIVPNVTDAEDLHALIVGLDIMQQYALAVRYGGSPAVFRVRRVGEHAMRKLADNAEILLHQAQ